MLGRRHRSDCGRSNRRQSFRFALGPVAVIAVPLRKSSRGVQSEANGRPLRTIGIWHKHIFEPSNLACKLGYQQTRNFASYPRGAIQSVVSLRLERIRGPIAQRSEATIRRVSARDVALQI